VADRALRFLQGAGDCRGRRPALLFGAVAWWSWERVNRETSTEIARRVDFFHQHALKLLKADELVLDRIDDRIEGLDWPEIIRREAVLFSFLHRLPEEIEEVAAAFIVDADGEVRSAAGPIRSPRGARRLRPASICAIGDISAWPGSSLER